MKKILKIPSAMQKAMQRGIVAKLCTICVLFFIPSGCENKEKDSDLIEIPFSEYYIEGDDGFVYPSLWLSWNNLKFDNTVIVVNNWKEMEKYLPEGALVYPDIDFSNHSVLLANGKTNYGISKITGKFWQVSTNKYRLDAEIQLNETTIIKEWCQALITSKLSDNSKVSLNAKTKK